MKTIFSLVLLCLCGFLYAQSVISPLLNSKLSEDNKEEIYLNINLYFSSYYDIFDLAKELDSRNASFHERNVEVVNLLKTNSEISQAAFIPIIEEILKSDKKAVSDIKFFWGVNMVNINIKKNLVYQLAEIRDVKYIDFNTPRYFIISESNPTQSVEKIVNGAEPGLKTINAHKLWELGYTGRNILFLSMDTGVFPEHPAIKDNFAGNYLPISQCWYGIRSEEPADHASSSHGTHTTGTALGLDPLNNDTIGVAFNAIWIASDPVASTNDDLLDPAEFMNVFQWVLDPDGNPETSDDVPRVINNSWGYDYTLAMEFGACDMEEAEIFVVLETAGICSPFSAGNDGPGVSTTGFPAMRVFNEVNPMAVGALTASNTIASFSSRGPTPCVELEGPLQIKPEVSAPGVNIRSCSGIDEYSYLQGTSMACPHVSGALLLLSEAFPMASAFELKYALYYTAIDMGDEGEDNIYGRGLIDVFAAYEYLSLTYTAVPPITNEYDLKISLLSPSDDFMCLEDSNPSLQIMVENLGQNPVDTFDIKIYVNDLLVCDSLIEIIIQPGEEFLFNSESYSLSTAKNYIHAIVKSYHDYNEYDKYNNGVNRKIYVLGETEFPYLENFELVNEDLSNSDLFILNPDFKNTWTNLSWGNESQYKAMGVNFNTYGSRTWEEDYASLPQINIMDDDSIFLVFTYAYKNRLVHYFNDSLIVELSNDCGINYNEVLFRDGGQTLATVSGDAMSSIYIPLDASEFDTAYISLENYRAQDVVIRFKTKNDRGSVVYIDQIEVKDLSVNNINDDFLSDNNTPLIYPNPAQGFVVIDCEYEDEQVLFSDISGKIILIRDLKRGKNYIEISDYLSGIYFIKFKNSLNSSKIVICNEK
ncbi:MAG: S8 family serine peptidase [Bacteroidales bacterium]|nr:S8 family serine peptidase [Bacteroidales bacterium]